MGNSVNPLSHNDTGKCSSIFQSCSSLTELDVDELAIHKEVGIPRGRLCSEAMKYLDRQSKALMFAASGTNVMQVKKCISFGASPDTYDQNRTSPLHIACRSGNLDIIKELIEERCNIDITDCAGWTSLHIASHCCHSHVVDFLLACGADASILNTRGETPFDLAHDPSTKKKFLKYWNGQECPHKTYYNVRRPKRTLTPYSEESSIVPDLWMEIGSFHCTYSLFGLEDVIRNIFNNNYRKGVAIMICGELVQQKPFEVAIFLYSSPRISPVKVGQALGDGQEFFKEVAKEFISFVEIEPHNLLASLAKLLRVVKLPKGLPADQILGLFSERFYSFRGPFSSKDAVHHLVFSIINLSNNLHIEKEDISLEEFIKSNRGLHDGGDFPEKYLSWIYESVKLAPIGPDFHEQTSPVFDEVTYSGHLRYQFSAETKEKYFILNSNALWCYKSLTQSTPYGCIPLWDKQISISSNFFKVSGKVCFLKFSESGSANLQYYPSVLFKMDSPDMWIKGLQQLIS